MCAVQPSSGPSSGGGGTGPSGYSQVGVYNCDSERRPVNVWVLDTGSGTGWQDKGTLSPQWDSSGSCPANGQPKVVTLQDQHAYWIVAVDPSNVTCDGNNDPTRPGCRRSEVFVRGSSTGGALPIIVN